MSREVRDLFVSALLVGGCPESRLLLHEVFRNRSWRLHEAPDRRRAMEWLAREGVHVVIAAANLPDWPWKRVLQDLWGLPRPPQLVVTSLTADDSLWAEVLNCGGYDLLPEPLQRDEVERVIASARRHFGAGSASGYRADAAAS